MKAFFRIVISLVLCAVLAACTAGYCVTEAFSETVTKENVRAHMQSRDLSGGLAATVSEYARPYLEELEEKPIMGILFVEGLGDGLDSFLESAEFKDYANTTVREYAEGLAVYLRTGEGNWEPDREALMDLAGPLTEELYSGSTLAMFGISSSMLTETVRTAIEENVLPYLEESVPDYSEVLASRHVSGRAAALRYAFKFRDSGMLMYAGIVSAALLVIVAVLLPRKGRRVLCTGWPGLGLLAGGGGAWFIGKSAERLAGPGQGLSEGLFADAAEIARGIAESFSDRVTAEARPFLIAGGVLLAIYLLLSAVLPEKKKQRIRQY